MGVVINPVKLHHDQELTGSAARVMANACYIFQLGRWRHRHRKATAENDYHTLDRLDREYETLGLP